MNQNKIPLFGFMWCVLLVLSFFVSACATKVTNPKTNDDQDDGNELLAIPENFKPFEIPVVIENYDAIDPAYRAMVKEMLAVSGLAGQSGTVMNRFFSELIRLKLKKNGAINVNYGGKDFQLKSWTKPTADGYEAGAYFCLGAELVGSFQWGKPDPHVMYVRNLSHELMIEDPPLIKNLPGRLQTKFRVDGSFLAANFTGRRRDVETLQDQDRSAVMQFVSQLNPETASYGFQGSSVDLNELGNIPSYGLVRAYGNFGQAKTAKILLHLDNAVCPQFDDKNVENPNWCVLAEVAESRVKLSQDSIQSAWSALKHSNLELPRRDLLQKVEFPVGLSCVP